jgi:hypothetical protein
MSKKKVELLVTGNMRCGTTWLTHALRHIGMDVMHECLGRDGTVSWFFSIDHPWYPQHPNNTPRGRTAHTGEGRRSDYKFEHVVHLVREPLKTLGSMQSIMQRSEQAWLMEAGIIPQDLEGPKLLRMMHAWYNINARVEKDADLRIRLEDMQPRRDVGWGNLMRLLRKQGRPLGGTPRPSIPVKNASRGIFKAKKVTWKQMAELDGTLAANIEKMADRYGY